MRCPKPLIRRSMLRLYILFPPTPSFCQIGMLRQNEYFFPIIYGIITCHYLSK